MKSISLKSKLLAAAFVVATVFVAMPAHATSYTYDGTGCSTCIMDTYSASWNTSTEMLSLSSSWTNMQGMDIDKISFLLSDGGSPWLSNGVEQFLFFTLDLNNDSILVEEYFGRADIANISSAGLNFDGSSFSLDFDTTQLGLHTGSFASDGLTYQTDIFDDTIGIWHYLYSNGEKKESYDIHAAQTVAVPEPTTMALLGLGLLGLVGRKKIAKNIT